MEFSAENQHFELKNQNQEFEFNPEQTFVEIENPINVELILENTHAEIELDGKSEEKISENDHTKLINRDVADQHPISAISGLQETLDNVKLPDNIITEEEFDVVKEEFSKALEDKANQVDFEQAVSDFGEALDSKQPKGNYALKSEIPNTSNFATKQELEQGLETKQPKGDYALKSDLENVQGTIEVSEVDNLIKENNVLKAFTEAGGGEITQEFIRTLNVPVEPPTGTWNSYITETGVLILYSNNKIVTTSDGVNFVVNTTQYNIRDMAKAYENQVIYCTTPSARLIISKDDGLTWEIYNNDIFQGLSWLSIDALNYRTDDGWSSMIVMNRSARVLSYVVSTDEWLENLNNRKVITYMTTLGHDFWFANANGEVFKTNQSLVFTYYDNAKSGVNTINTANGLIFCGFTDGTIAYLDLGVWTYFTVAQGETVTDIKYYNGVYYVVTNGANYYTSTDLTTWDKVDLINNYGGLIHFTNFGIVTVNSEANLLPSRKRIENALIDLYNKQDELSEVNQIAYSNSLFTIDYCNASNYDEWLLNGLQQYYDGTKWKKSTILFIVTSDGEMYDPITNSDNIEVKKYDVVRIAYDSWGSSAPPSVIGNLQELVGADNFVTNAQFNAIVQQSTQAINNLDRALQTKQPIGDYATRSELANVSINVSENDNLYKDENILKVFTEAGNSAITSRFARLLNVAQKTDWKSLVTDTGVLILYSGSVSYRTTNGIDFKEVFLPASPSDMAKNYENQTIYCPVSSSAGMWMYSTDDGLTWTYNTEKSLGSLAWNKVCIKNNGSQKTGWNSAMCFVRAGGATTQNFANFLASANRFELNSNSKKRIDFVTGLNYDYWCANVQGEVFKTAGSSTFTIYENTKYGLTHIENCNGTIFCGFQDGTIAECMGYKQPWTYYTVAQGEKVTDIKYRDGVYYVVTNACNFYTSTDKVNWTKTAVLNSYGGKLEFTRFGVVQVTNKPVLLPSRQRLEDLLLYLFDRTDFAKICGAGLKWENGQITIDLSNDIPLRLTQGRLNLFNIDKMFFSEEIILSLISAMFTLDYCPADNYDGWLWENTETGYWDGEAWQNRSILWICTGDGYIYDPLGYSWELEVAQFDVLRIIYDEWGNGTTAEKIGSLSPLKDLFNS